MADALRRGYTQNSIEHNVRVLKEVRGMPHPLAVHRAHEIAARAARAAGKGPAAVGNPARKSS